MSAPTTRRIRKSFTLADAGREFWRHPSPWMISATLVAALTARIIVGDWQYTDAIVPLVMLAVFPFFEWVVHVTILHAKPLHVGRLTIDSRLAKDHRAHHVDPRQIPLIFIPWKALLWILPLAVAISVFLFPRIGLGLTYLTFIGVLGIVYEWSHYLIHSDYKPKTRVYRAIWRDHRLHHYKNEHYWFTVTTSGTADRVLGTFPKAEDIPSSPTAKNLPGASS